MNRLIKKVASENTLLEIINKLDANALNEMIDAIARNAKTWMEMEAEDLNPNDFDGFDFMSDYTEEMLTKPDEILEAIIDYFPEQITDNMVYNAIDKNEAVRFILDKSDAKLSQVFDDEYTNSMVDVNTNENNLPYGPGMNQRDFV